MIDIAAKHENELRRLFADITFDEEFMFMNPSSYVDQFTIETGTWNKHQFVSLNAKGEVVGYFKYNIDRDTLNCGGLLIVNFKKDTLSRVFGTDLKQIIDDIFIKFKFRKLKFGVIVGNPAERFYDKYITSIGGRVVGTYKDECKLIDGNYYDYKEYEVLRNDYLLSN